MDLGLAGRVALVGGASRGLGFAIAGALAAEGVRVAMISRDIVTIENAAEAISGQTGSDVLPIQADTSRAADVDRAVDVVLERYGRIDVLVTNTGGPPSGGALEADDGAWQAAFEGLLLSTVRLTRRVVPGMRERRWGRVIHNTSFTVREPAERLVLSNAMRAGVVAFSKTLAREVAPDGITVNCVGPGAFDTQRLARVLESEAASSGRSLDDVREAWEAKIPIGRFGRPEELAALVAFLASDSAAAITGGFFAVDGGMLRSLF